jgi:hypothetical protein
MEFIFTKIDIVLSQQQQQIFQVQIGFKFSFWSACGLLHPILVNFTHQKSLSSFCSPISTKTNKKNQIKINFLKQKNF